METLQAQLGAVFSSARASQREEAQARLDAPRYLVRVIDDSGLTGFVGDGFQPSKSQATYFVQLKNAIDTKAIAARVYKSAWIVFE